MLEPTHVYTPDPTRYASMDYVRCGTSGLRLPQVALGLWHNFGDLTPMGQMQQVVFTAFDNGITYFDLANNYGPEPGAAERNFGQILRRHLHAHRDELVIATKAGFEMWEGPYGAGGSRKYLLTSLDQSLARLGLDYVDVFYHHCMDPETPLEESMGALATAVTSGRALYAGLSNYDGPTLERATQLLDAMHVPFIVNQNRYNMFDRTIEHNGLKEATRKLGKGLVTFSPLDQGLLSDRYLHGIPADSRIAHDGRFLHQSQLDEKITQIRALNDLAQARGQSLAQMALAWLLHDEAVTTVLVGASKPEQILDDLTAIDNTDFTQEELQRINEITGA
ncbi:aldo/keto reductase [Bifidobacterium pseudolongum]|uniref:L-glyceraldehyde 3-phosphate reductase n=1 Tax=Bifidobacterium pseudolongum TaxID=1694 RepID=A0A395XFJ5_9BIFI|nr:L-glyceraldehyde 3-phosphate reductase [Bifidobacterium pseudolongum]